MILANINWVEASIEALELGISIGSTFIFLFLTFTVMIVGFVACIFLLKEGVIKLGMWMNK